MRENYSVALSLSEDAFEHIDELPCTISTVELPEFGFKLFFVLLNGARLYTQADKTLYVFSVRDLISPIMTYELSGDCSSGLIADNCLFLDITD